jgi:hypothetical protein
LQELCRKQGRIRDCVRSILPYLLCRCELTDFRLGRWGWLDDWLFASAASRVGVEGIDLPVGQESVTRLRDHDALTGKLLLEAHRAAIGANAHGARCFESDKKIPGAIADGDWLHLKLRGVNRHRWFALNTSVNRPSIEGRGQETAGFQQ